MNAKHTPGPWRVRIIRRQGWASVDFHPLPEDSPCFATLQVYEAGEAESLAHLIAAAPDLLEVAVILLKRFDLEPVDAHFPGSAMRDQLRAAIRKARGE